MFLYFSDLISDPFSLRLNVSSLFIVVLKLLFHRKSTIILIPEEILYLPQLNTVNDAFLDIPLFLFYL